MESAGSCKRGEEPSGSDATELHIGKTCLGVICAIVKETLNI
jgi:hypothetical protein